MISAEKVTIGGRDWIKVKFRNHPVLTQAMEQVHGARFNPESKLWSVPYEYREDFERKMSDHLIVWKDDESGGAGGINEDRIPDQPIAPGYSVTYDANGKVESAVGFKTAPYGMYQVKGFNALVKRDFLILADEAGLGKTWQVSTAMEARKSMGQLKFGLVICKATLLYNWRDEIAMHTGQRSVIASGSYKQRIKLYNRLYYSDDWTFLIISYETYREDIGALKLLHSKRPLDFCIIDEAHKVKNPSSRVGALIHSIPYKFKYILTATPLPNSPAEAYNYLKWGGIVKMNPFEFENRYLIKGGYNNREVIGYRHINELKRLVQSHMLRRLKRDKLKELPDIIHHEVLIPMSPQQKVYYNAVKEEIMEDLKDTSLQRIPSALAKLTRLQQITDHPALIGAPVDSPSAKLEALDDMLEDLIDEGKQKVIIYSRFRDMVLFVQERYKEKYNPAVVHGDVDANGVPLHIAEQRLKKQYEGWDSLSPSKKEDLIKELSTSERQKEVYKFQHDDTCKIFVGCAPACREGLTLTSATHVIFLDCEWSPAYVSQAHDRAHRIGQKNVVNVHYLVCEDTIDVHVQEVLKLKASLAHIILDDNGSYSDIGSPRAKNVVKFMIGEEKSVA